MSATLTTSPVASSSPDAPASDRELPPLPHGWTSLTVAFLQAVRRHWGKAAILDSTKASLTYGQTLTRALVLKNVLARTLDDARYVGVLLPPLVPTAVTNLALALSGRIAVNLNYTANSDIVNSAIRQCGITHVISSHKALDRFKLQLDAKIVALEDVAKSVTIWDKARGATAAQMARFGGLFGPGPAASQFDETATVIFTSGSTGDPKGVVLTHRNILSNVHAINEHLRLRPDEVLLGILPFFHSMGYTVTFWTGLCLGKTIAYHANPLDARIVGDLCEKHKVSLLVSTPTFARNYLAKCKPEQFGHLTYLVLGAEKLKPELAQDLRDGWKVEPLEGYGCTELSPVVAVNVPYDIELSDSRQVSGNKPGTVGRLLPGTMTKMTDPDTGADLPPGETGLVWIKGPQVMAGYLNRPDETAKAIQDGWYNTGDLGRLDEDGFLTISDRLSRFSKIGGEMVPHVRVESALMAALGVDERTVAVTGVPDPRRGERLVVLHACPELDAKQVVQALADSGLPKLWLPGAGDFVRVEAIPILGSGKVDLRQLKQIAREATSSGPA
jgi:acyl-[acyl-carrier-protein]-phospholipid O-acyltransferase/long-chain-fatty-acid--[acyl-carrier-protein] ligase